MEEAELMNNMARAYEAMRMHPTIQPLRESRELVNHEVPRDLNFKGGSADLQTVVRTMAKNGWAELEKDAFGMAMMGNILKNVGSKLQSFTGTGRLAQAAGTASGTIGGLGTKMLGKGTGMAAAAAKPASKPFMSMGTKAKVLGGGALMGAGYAGYKGLQATRDYMMTPSGGGNFHGGGSIPQSVNQYGYAGY
jgi:hypothetical protein